MDTERNMVFDTSRAICVLWIVGFWHMLNYLPESYQLPSDTRCFFVHITNAVLGCFTFISGYFLQKYKFQCWNDVKSFYVKRIMRFYPLLLISVLSFYLIERCNIFQAVTTLTGTTLFTINPISTLWYFSLIIFFYFITPVIAYNRMGGGMLIVKTLALFVILVSFTIILDWDKRTILFYPVYCMGLLLPHQFVQKHIGWQLLCFSLLGVVFLAHININFFLSEYLYVILGVAFLLSLSSIVYSNKINKIISVFSFSSMAAYLFHRQVYFFTFGIFAKIDYFGIPVFVQVAISLITLFFVSYLVQCIYDKILINKNI